MTDGHDTVQKQDAPGVLFLCVKNGARSQMAEALFKVACPERFSVESAGLDAGELNPLAVAAMGEIGIDISGNSTQSVFDVIKSGRLFSYVVTVCDEASAEKCPVFPGVVQRLHWNTSDPAALEGTWEQRIEGTRAIRQEIGERVESFCNEVCR